MFTRPATRPSTSSAVDAVARADLLGCPPGRSRRRRPTAAPTAAARPRAQVEAPVDRRHPAPAAWPAPPPPPVSSRNRSSSRSRICRQRQGPHPDRRQLEGQRYAVQPPAHLDHLARLGLVDRELRQAALRTRSGEQQQRLVLIGIGGRTSAGGVDGVGTGKGLLALHAEHMPAGGQDPQLGAAASSLLTSTAHASASCSQLSRTAACACPPGTPQGRQSGSPNWLSSSASASGVAEQKPDPAGRRARRTGLRRGTFGVARRPSAAPAGSCRPADAGQGQQTAAGQQPPRSPARGDARRSSSARPAASHEPTPPASTPPCLD